MSNATPDRLDRIESLLEETSQRVNSNTRAIQELGQKLDSFAKEIKAETEALKKSQEKWDERFFEMSRNMTNLAFGLIATATITIIVTSVFK